MKIGKYKIPNNSVKYPVISKLTEQEALELLDTYQEIELERDNWLRGLSEDTRYSPVAHAEANNLMMRADKIFPGITKTRRGGWGRLSGYASNHSVKDTLLDPRAIEEEVFDLLSSPLCPSRLMAYSPQQLMNALPWEFGHLMATASEGGKKERQELLDILGRLTWTYRKWFKHKSDYREIIQNITREYPDPTLEGEKGRRNLLRLLHIAIQPILRSLNTHETVFLLILVNVSPLIPQTPVVARDKAFWDDTPTAQELGEILAEFHNNPDCLNFHLWENKRNTGGYLVGVHTTQYIRLC